MKAQEQLDRARKLVMEAKKLKKRREQLLASGTSLVEIDAEIERNQIEYQELLDFLTPLINRIRWDQLCNILYKFYIDAAPMSEVVSTVIDLPVDQRSLSFAQSRKRMAIKDLQKEIDSQKIKK